MTTAYYGMEWNMEWKEKIGMEDLMYGMEQICHIPYKFHSCTFWQCCWSSVFLSVEDISKQSLSSIRTAIRKLRAFFIISVTNSNVDAKRRSLILILFSWGQGTLSPDFCMFTSVLPACCSSHASATATCGGVATIERDILCTLTRKGWIY